MKAFSLPFEWHTVFKSMCSGACPVIVTLLSNNALKWWPCRFPPTQHAPMFSVQHTCPTNFFLETVIQLYWKTLFWKTFHDKYYHKPQKNRDHIFIMLQVKGLEGSEYDDCSQETKKIFTEAILLHAKLSNIYIYIYGSLSELHFERIGRWIEKHFFVDKVLQLNQFSNERICLIRYFETDCQLLQ